MSLSPTLSLNGKFRFPLDFTLATSEAREAYVTNLINVELSTPYAQDKKNQLHLFTQKELETFSNYILYGKDSATQLSAPDGTLVGGTSVVDRGEISIEAKHTSYARKTTESLNGLMESPTFNENELSPIRAKANKYTTPKVNFSRAEARKDEVLAAELEPLWAEIDRVDYIIRATNPTTRPKLLNDLVIELGPDEGTRAYNDLIAKPVDSLTLYKLRHLLIDLRKQQYVIRDCFLPATLPQTQKSIYCGNDDLGWGMEWGDVIYEIGPLGAYKEGDLKFTEPTKLPLTHHQHHIDKELPLINFTDPAHIRLVFEGYLDLETEALRNPLSGCKDLLTTIKFYTELTDLSPSYRRILELKIQKKTNSYIANIVNKEFNIHHTENYISTIYCQKICGDIADTAILNYDGYMARLDPFKWKVCSGCGKKHLKDTRVFTRKTRSSDGLSNKCKLCEKHDRQINKDKVKEPS